MSKKVKVWIEQAAVREGILKSSEMAGIIGEIANGVAQRAGNGYEVEVKSGRYRVYANIRTATYDAVRDNSENNTLLRSLK